jgi:activator of 2-hydroxyglutaryl-CoA dehydratase
MLHQAKRELGTADNRIRVFMTGSGGQHLAELLGARFVQEVAAVSLAVETSFPDVRSVIELGGQDAKMIIFQEGADPGRRKKIASMNDKCAGGTGVVIEKIAAKLHVSSEELFTEKVGGCALVTHCRQVRSLCRDRHYRAAKTGRPRESPDGLSVSRHRPAEPLGAHAGKHLNA